MHKQDHEWSPNRVDLEMVMANLGIGRTPGTLHSSDQFHVEIMFSVMTLVFSVPTFTAQVVIHLLLYAGLLKRKGHEVIGMIRKYSRALTTACKQKIDVTVAIRSLF